MIKKILIANRGEIAVRVINACRETSIPTVAVYSTADRKSLHVQMADEAICIGDPPPLESYLNIDKIIGVAKKTGADAIHPGYGFLAENSDFSARCEQEGIIFIGPNSKALRLVGDKVASRETMTKAKIPIIPGMMTKGKEMREFEEAAEKIGYPVMIKASAGGGGKGMRIIHSPNELEKGIEAGMREAKSAFGDESVYLEKYIEEPRHVEFQILADNFGNVVHLFERECSIQRRHQKIVEETPSCAIGDELRKKMGDIAKKVIKVSGYNNAGTVEFLLDKNKNFYFLEVNARIQVEHPITELVTGVDLVKQQIRIASGEKLSLKQEQIKQRGHAIECRIYAEDPENNFFPSAGKILFMKEPAGPGIRHDCGIYSGFEVPVYYDPILSKVITWAETREDARRRMILALSNYTILGIKTTIGFLSSVMAHPEFTAGNTQTNFIEKNMSDWADKRKERKFLNEALIAAAVASQSKTAEKRWAVKEKTPSPWLTVGRWNIGGI
ncbi:MAG: acetyl-CoA carboxylase biotin carboxylase subunit [candidate division Zixibacteria bacterium]|nr:acetyl-CoA carboxylase biotin carboxylase subunit [candidate division Zixibacteria bacterium]